MSMEELLKELDTLERLTSFTTSPGISKKGKTHSIADSLDTLLAALAQAKHSLTSGSSPQDAASVVVQNFEDCRKSVEERQKEGANAFTKFSKAVDKTFTNGLPSMPQLFSSDSARRALDRSVATHLIRNGDFDIADVFIQESLIEIPPETSVHFRNLHSILSALQSGDVQPALSWARENQEFLESRASPLRFELHRFQYLGILFASDPPDTNAALQYARENITPMYSTHQEEIRSLLNALLYTPLQRLRESPYADLASPTAQRELAPLLSKEWCAKMGLPKEPPLSIIADIGGGPALSVLETNRRKMAKTKNEWSQSNELPVSLPVPLRHRYHTVVCCPVVREPTTEENPPMLLTCGHVISKEAITRLQKAGHRVKCPYCPTESQANTALRLYF